MHNLHLWEQIYRVTIVNDKHVSTINNSYYNNNNNNNNTPDRYRCKVIGILFNFYYNNYKKNYI